jgi:hypothetical protein
MKMNSEQFKQQFNNAMSYATGSLKEEISNEVIANPNYDSHRTYADSDYDAPEPTITVKKVIPKGHGQNLTKALNLFKELKENLNTSDLSEKDKYNEEVDLEIGKVEKQIENKYYQPLVTKLLTKYQELLIEYISQVKSKYGENFFDAEDGIFDEKLLEEKGKYEGQAADEKDPGPLYLCNATYNMISALKEEQESESSPKERFDAWKKLYKGEEGDIIKSDRGTIAQRIGNEIARIVNAIFTWEYKKEFEFFKSHGKEQHEDKEVVQLSNMNPS